MIRIHTSQAVKVINWCSENISAESDNHRFGANSGPGWSVCYVGLATYEVKFDDDKYETLLRLIL